MMEHTSGLNVEAKRVLNERLVALETKLGSDLVSLVGEIQGGSETVLRHALEPLTPKREKLTFLLQTPGGIVEIAERIVNLVRHHYKEVVFLVPGEAMSAGTILVMSGDEIMMDYMSCLGPIDPQVPRRNGGGLVPALSYIDQFNRLVRKSRKGSITNAEFLLLQGMDLAELRRYQMARQLSVRLLRQWLATYKFKDWKQTETQGRAVSPEDREQRAEEIANALMDNKRWGSHGRGIPMKRLQDELKLRIHDFGADQDLYSLVRRYFTLLTDYIVRNKVEHFVHSRCFL